jgi:hypothetical protein
MLRILPRRTLQLLPGLMSALLPALAHGQWVENGAAVTAVPGNQVSSAIISDAEPGFGEANGLNGAIISWRDDRNGAGDIYVQRVDVRGYFQWAANGVAICTAPNEQINPQLVSDGVGGAIVVWQDFRAGNYDIYAQRVDAAGVPQWTADGVVLCTEAYEQSLPQIVTDGAGGAFVSWRDLRAGNYDIYGQRVNAEGVAEWGASGIALTAPADQQVNHRMIAGSAGDAIIVWQDFRWGQYDIYGQRVDASGLLWWTEHGILVCTAPGRQEYPELAPDGAGGRLSPGRTSVMALLTFTRSA